MSGCVIEHLVIQFVLLYLFRPNRVHLSKASWDIVLADLQAGL